MKTQSDMVRQPLMVNFSNILEKTLCVLQDGFIILNRQSRIVCINKSAQETLIKLKGTCPQVGDDYLSFFDREKAHHRCLDKAFHNFAVVFEESYSVNSRKKSMEISYYPIPEENGMITNILIRSRDITEKAELRKKLEKQKEAEETKIIKAKEEERTQIASELHDNVNQLLTAAKLYNEVSYNETLPNYSNLQKSNALIQMAISEIRAISQKLSCTGDDCLSLNDLLSELTKSIRDTKKINTLFITRGLENEKINKEMRIALYRIAQEQLTNVLKHSGASKANILLIRTPTEIILRIKDNGKGFNLNQKKTGFGLTSIKGRIKALKGNFKIETEMGKGCSLVVKFPLHKKSARRIDQNIIPLIPGCYK